jgi:hypothetical protein
MRRERGARPADQIVPGGTVEESDQVYCFTQGRLRRGELAECIMNDAPPSESSNRQRDEISICDDRVCHRMDPSGPSADGPPIWCDRAS